MVLRWSFLCFLSILPAIFSARYTINNGPSLANSDSIQFFYLEAPFPYNAPQSIKDAAGQSFNKYGITHAGLGIWDTTTDDKFTIELVSNNYVGGLLPSLSNGNINWQNAASIVITDPMDENVWLNSRLITTTSGSAYSQLITYLQGNSGLFAYYQPVTALYVNVSLINTSQAVTTDDIDEVGKVLVQPINSFAFVDNLISQLGSYGCDLGAYLQIYATAFDYISKQNKPPTVVSWAANGPANPEVYQWYQNLHNCYNQTYKKMIANKQGASYFLSGVKSCYYNVAYFFRSTTSVYNMTLGNSSGLTYDTPMLTQYVYNLPSSNDGDKEKLQPIDYVIIAIALLAVTAVVYFFFMKLFGKKARRRVSFEGERVAVKTVENITSNNPMTAGDDDNEDRAYFHGRNNQNAQAAMNRSRRGTATNSLKISSLSSHSGAGGDRPSTSTVHSLATPLIDEAYDV